jgi:hypothetical protein
LDFNFARHLHKSESFRLSAVLALNDLEGFGLSVAYNCLSSFIFGLPHTIASIDSHPSFTFRLTIYTAISLNAIGEKKPLLLKKCALACL